MWVINLTCDFGDFDYDMMVYLTIWIMSALDNASKFSFDMIYLELVSGGRRNLVMSSFSALRFLYGGQLLFVDRNWKKEEQTASHHF